MTSIMFSGRPINTSSHRKRVSLMPRSNVPQVLLHDNCSQQNLLNLTLHQLEVQQVRTQRTLELRRRSFLTEQALKQEQLSERGVHHVAIIPAGVANAYSTLTRFYTHRVKSLPPAIHVHEEYDEDSGIGTTETEKPSVMKTQYIGAIASEMEEVPGNPGMPPERLNTPRTSAHHRFPDIHKKLSRSFGRQLMQKFQPVHGDGPIIGLKMPEDGDSDTVPGISPIANVQTVKMRQTSHSWQGTGKSVNTRLHPPQRSRPPSKWSTPLSTKLLLRDPRFLALQQKLTLPDPSKYIDGFLALSDTGMAVIHENRSCIDAWQVDQNPTVGSNLKTRSKPIRRQSVFRPDISDSPTSLHFSTDSEFSEDEDEN